MNTAPSASTCLFTGAILPPGTKIEHTIQQSVGGRILSPTVTADDFNEAAGREVDEPFGRGYAAIFNRIGLLTHAGNKPPRLKADYEGDGDFVFEPGGILTRRKPIVDYDKKERKLRSVTAGNIRDLERVIKTSNQRPEDWKIRAVPAALGINASFDTGVFSYKTEVAALKSILLTYDHLLYDDSRRFTRSTQLKPVIEFVRAVVMDRKIDPLVYSKFILGFQYDKLAELQRLRNCISTPKSEFEHFMVVSANATTRSLDAVWLVSEIDPYGFRLCDNWIGEAFTCAIVSGVLKETTTSAPIWLNKEFSCGLQPDWRMGRRAGTGLVPVRQMLRAIGTYHLDGIRKAIDLVERNCPDHVCECIAQNAQARLCAGLGGRVSEALKDYIIGMYVYRLIDNEKKCAFDEIMNRHLSSLDASLATEAIDHLGQTINEDNRHLWMRVYVSILDELKEPLGLPGEVGQPAEEVELDSVEIENPDG